MKITLNGNINRTYVQSMCMAFFHGVKFPLDNSASCDDGLMLSVSLEGDNESIVAIAKLEYNGTSTTKEISHKRLELESEKRAEKTAVGQAVYHVCRQITGKDIEWGILTGIRPSKVCLELLQKHSEENVLEILKNQYLLSDEKAKLIVEVTKNESYIMSLTNDKKCSLYISIPFCPSRCNYCSFISYAGKKLFDLIPSYLEKLFEDIIKTVSIINDIGLEISSIYIGGGTPTILNEKQLESLLSVINECVDTSSLMEFTLEGGRPDTITDKKLQIAKCYGVDRISVNPQTLNDDVLEKIGRRHTSLDFFKAFEKVKKGAIKSVNTDLIAGLDGDDFESFKKTVDKIIVLEPSNVTVHTFCVKKSAQILRDDESIFDKDDSEATRCVNYAYKTLTESGYIPYYLYRQKNTIGNLENVGYAKKGHLGLYNVFMMSDAHTVFGIGAGATTKLVRKNGEKTEILRIFSQKYPYEYLRDNQKSDDQIKEFFDRR